MKITLLGDSIRRSGYGQLVPQLLGNDFQVYQPEENCKFAKYTLRGLFDWQKDMEGSKIVHWNNGLWDTCDLFGDGLFNNSIIVPLLKEKGIVINDLYSLVASDIDKYIRKDDMIHLTDAGIVACSDQVAKIIIDVSKTLDIDDKDIDDCMISDDHSNGAPV